ncbi:carbohydrate ABC transporter permease [Acidipropionibacterium acidipropionici]|uniref:carbohydrate ABC transporter permease n=1 Tax=Acidipropionibacterium acidipropionici TaxID=1748 RepID=UPI001E643FEB|nr:sugar ABC transporter permease [Acidipropionibacterium acidipropionici]
MSTVTEAAGRRTGTARRRTGGATTGPSIPAGRRPVDWSGPGFVIPFVVLGLIFFVWPVISGFVLSFTNHSLTGLGNTFAGLSNYGEALTDPQVWETFGQTVMFTVISTIPLVLIGLIMALLVNTGVWGQWFWRLSFFASYLLPSAVVASVFVWIFASDIGLADSWTAALGMDPVGWLTKESTALWTIAGVTVWWTVGFNFLLFSSALQGIPLAMYEASMFDGAGAWRRLFSITLPQLKSITGVIVALQLLASLKVFDQIYMMTAGGPNGSTRSILEYIYDTGFTNYRMGYASAISYVFFAIILILSLFTYLPGRRGQR